MCMCMHMCVYADRLRKDLAAAVEQSRPGRLDHELQRQPRARTRRQHGLSDPPPIQQQRRQAMGRRGALREPHAQPATALAATFIALEQRRQPTFPHFAVAQ